MNSKNTKKFSIDLNSFIHVDKDKAWKNVNNTISKYDKTIKRRKLLLLGAAVSIFAVIMIGSITSIFNEKKSPHVNNTEMGKIEEIIIYTEGSEKIIIKDSNTIVNKNGNIAVESNIISSSDTIKTIIVEVPFGKTHSIILSDETKVTLNANSKIIFPSKFEQNVRKVEIHGEAFFEVKKSNIQFVVATRGVNIKVYGTKFNVNAYSQDQVEMVLISGSVGISINGNPEVILKPNQISVSNLNTKKSIVKEIETNKYTAWLSGYFMYDRDSLTRMLNDMTSWYGVNIVIDNCNFENTLMTGSFDKNSPIEDIITSIEETTKLKFIKERRDRYRIIKQ